MCIYNLYFFPFDFKLSNRRLWDWVRLLLQSYVYLSSGLTCLICIGLLELSVPLEPEHDKIPNPFDAGYVIFYHLLQLQSSISWFYIPLLILAVSISLLYPHKFKVAAITVKMSPLKSWRGAGCTFSLVRVYVCKVCLRIWECQTFYFGN